MTNPGHIDRLWRSFEAAVIPEEAGELQRREMRRAFFAGARGLFATFCGGLDPTDPDAVTDEDVMLVEHIAQELQVFRDQVAAGSA